MTPEEYYPIPPTKIQKAIICTPEEVQMWKDENLKLKTRITALEAQVAALKEIAVEGHAKEIYPFIMPMWEHLPEEDTWIDDKLFGKSKQVGKSTYRYHARSQLAEEHPEAFR